MSMVVQYAIVFALVAVAAVAAWRILTGRRALSRGRKQDSCAGCGSAGEHRH